MRLSSCLALLAWLVPGCGPPPQDLLVCAAISLKAPLEAVGHQITAQGGQVVRFNFAGSGELLQQLKAGAPADLFFSASPREMDEAQAAGLLLAGSRRVVAGNGLVLVTPWEGPAIHSFADLGQPQVERIAVGDKGVPVGHYAMEVLAWHKLDSIVRPKLIFATNARQVLDYVIRGEVDAGLVYATDARACSSKLRVVAQAPPGSHTSVRCEGGILASSQQLPAAQAFLAMVTGDAGRRMLANAGFQLP